MNILVLCTGNSARFIVLESILSHCRDGRICAYSAGSNPTGRVNPVALAQLSAVELPDSGYSSKTWDEFATLYALVMDLVITVCGNARDETCPIWLGAPVSAHWGVDNPTEVSKPPKAVQNAFSAAYTRLRMYTDAFMAEPVEDMDRDALIAHLLKVEGMK